MQELKHIPVAYAASIIQNYIYQIKGVMVNIELPVLPQYQEKFILAFNIACLYFDITI